MNEKYTIFILGAGASADYEFPIGQNLLRKIQGYFRENVTEFIDALNIYQEERENIPKFKQAVLRSGKKSIDAFLEGRPQYIKLGKLAIAYSLIPYENEAKLYEEFNPEKESWYQYLYNKLIENKDLIEGDKVKIITYNYDRSLEHYLVEAYRHDYGVKPNEAWDFFKGLGFIHVHGKLGDLPCQNKDQNRVYAQNQGNANILTLAANNIKIVHEDISKDPEFKEIHSLIAFAKRIVFLGFGYDKTNLKRLKIGELNPLASIMGTAYGLTKAEISIIKDDFTRLNIHRDHIFLDSPSYDCISYLKANCILDMIV